jgi:chloramphenicol-sensitive protein RarD
VETSLGYFINPLITVLLGVFLLRETLRKPQWVAVGIASIAIVVLAVDYGRLPWIALVLATSFGMYGYFKKRAAVGAAESLAVETGVLALPALTVLLVLQLQGSLVFAHNGGGNTALATTGVVTAIPLQFFAAATRRLRCRLALCNTWRRYCSSRSAWASPTSPFLPSDRSSSHSCGSR